MLENDSTQGGAEILKLDFSRRVSAKSLSKVVHFLCLRKKLAVGCKTMKRFGVHPIRGGAAHYIEFDVNRANERSPKSDCQLPGRRKPGRNRPLLLGSPFSPVHVDTQFSRNSGIIREIVGKARGYSPKSRLRGGE